MILSGFAFPLANGWLTFDELSENDVKLAIIFAAATAAFRWPVAVYSGILSGLERQVLANAFTTVFGIVRLAVGVGTVMWVNRSVHALLLSTLVVAVCEVFSLRWAAMQKLGMRHPRRWRIDSGVVSRVWRFAVGAGAVGAMGTFLANADKVILGKSVSLHELGIYSTIATIAAVIPMLGNAVCAAAFPRLARASIHDCKQVSMRGELQDAARLTFLLTFPCLLLLAFFGREVLVLILGPALIAKDWWLILILSASGGFLNALASPFYASLLASGSTSRLLVIHLGLAAVLLPYYILALPRFGAHAAAAGWFTHSIILLIACYTSCQRYLWGVRWARRTFILTNAIIVALFALASWVATSFDHHIPRLIIGMVLAGAAVFYVGGDKYKTIK